MASRSWNRVELIGNVTKDPELRYTPSGAAVVTFTIATNRTFVSDGEKKEEADFHRVVAWNKLAELCSQLIKKGNRVFVSGRLQNRSWEQDGQTKYMTETVIEDMILLTSKFGGSGDYSAEENSGSVPAEVPSRSVEEMPAQFKSEKSDESDQSEKSDKSASAKTTADKSEEPEDSEEPKKKSEKPATEDVNDLDDLPF